MSSLTLLAMLIGVSVTLPARAAGAAAVDREGWPETRAGELARRWVTAFSTGEAAMRECLAEVMAPESLAKKGLGARVERYRDLRERYGTLTLAAVERSAADRLEVTLVASDLSRHRFIFTLQPRAPRKLLSVAIQQPGHGFPGFGH